MARFLTTNPYGGVNAHLNSWLQSPNGGWESFHSDFVTYLKSGMNQILPQGYYARTERALAIRDEEDVYLGTRLPDVGIFHRPATAVSPTSPTLEMAFDELYEPPIPKSVRIYEAKSGQLITSLEVLSPSNKRHAQEYPCGKKC